MMNVDERNRIERDASDIVHRFFRHLDDGDYEDLAALMATEGVWHRQGKALIGPAMVLEAMRARPAGTTTRHLVTNMLVDAVDAHRVEASCYITVYAHTGETKPGEPAPLELPLQIGTYRILVERGAQGCRIGEIAAKIAFRK